MIGKALTAEYKPDKKILPNIPEGAKGPVAAVASGSAARIAAAAAGEHVSLGAFAPAVNSDSIRDMISGMVKELIKELKEEIEELKEENEELRAENKELTFAQQLDAMREMVKHGTSAAQEDPASPGNTAGTTTPPKNPAAGEDGVNAARGQGLIIPPTFTGTITIS